MTKHVIMTVIPSVAHEGFFIAYADYGALASKACARSPERAVAFALRKIADELLKPKEEPTN